MCLGSVPGQEEFEQGKPFAGQSGKNLDGILSNLKYEGKFLSRSDVSIDNSWPHPLWEGKHGCTEASLKEICSDENLTRLYNEIGKDTKIVIAFGDNAFASAEALKKKYNLPFRIVKTSHPSFSHINRKYESSMETPEQRTADRLRQMSEELKAASDGLFT